MSHFMSCQKLPVNVSRHSLATVSVHMFGGFSGETYAPECLRVVARRQDGNKMHREDGGAGGGAYFIQSEPVFLGIQLSWK